jgi:hypothetical protein
MGRPLFRAPRRGALTIRLPNLATLGEDLFHQIVAGECAAGPPPVLGASWASMVGEQGADLFFESRDAFFNRHLGHDGNSWTIHLFGGYFRRQFLTGQDQAGWHVLRFGTATLRRWSASAQARI